MASLTWDPDVALPMDPNGVKDFTFDWTTWLSGETITDATVTPTNCTASYQSKTNTTVTYRVSAVALNASVTVRVTTNTGQIDEKTQSYYPKQM